MRDLETIQVAISAAETGHLVLATLHTRTVEQAVQRMVDVFPAQAKDFIRHQLSLSLRAIVCQQLLPLKNQQGRVPAVEILRATYPVRHHIRQEALHKLYNEITLGQRQGMVSLEKSLAELVRSGLVERDEARVRSARVEEFDSLLARG